MVTMKCCKVFDEDLYLGIGLCLYTFNSDWKEYCDVIYINHQLIEHYSSPEIESQPDENGETYITPAKSVYGIRAKHIECPEFDALLSEDADMVINLSRV